ncbi:MAG: D-Ala-D-Ala carboxypeptidase family metallohydrolase, partial [Leifsonia flava]
MYENWPGQGYAAEGFWGFESPFVTAEDPQEGFGQEPFGGELAGYGAEAGEVEESESSDSEAFASDVFDSEGFAYGQPFAESAPVFEGEGFPSGLTLSAATGATGEKQEHWDPHKTGLPLLATGPAMRTKKLSPNFTVGELVKSGGRYADAARISPALVRLLQAIRDRAGRSVSITSGYRSWARNKQVYAGYGKTATLSRHCSGQAADIRISGMSGLDIARLAIDVGGPDIGVGIGGTYAHVDVRGTWAVWTYLTGDAGKQAVAAIVRHRAQRTGKGGPAPSKTPDPRPPSVPVTPGTTTGGDLVVDRHPVLRGHAGTPPDLVLRWNAMSNPSAIDI